MCVRPPALHSGISHGFSVILASVEGEVECPTHSPSAPPRLVGLFAEGTKDQSSGVKEGGQGFQGVPSVHKVCVNQTFNKHSPG